jgi:hydrogenase-4 component B
MPAVAGLVCVAALFAIGLIAIAIGRSRAGTTVVYAASAVVTLAAFLFALAHLILASPAATITLPLGLPWIGAHFRVDALAAFFLIIVNLGGAIASLYALGYGAHETSPLRVLPFYPAFSAP